MPPMADDNFNRDYKLRLREQDDGTWSVDVLDADDSVVHSEEGFASQDDATNAGTRAAGARIAEKLVRDRLGKR